MENLQRNKLLRLGGGSDDMVKRMFLVTAVTLLAAGCATDTFFTIERDAEGRVERIHHAQRMARYIPAIGKSTVTEGTSELDSSVFPDLKLIDFGDK